MTLTLDTRVTSVKIIYLVCMIDASSMYTLGCVPISPLNISLRIALFRKETPSSVPYTKVLNPIALDSIVIFESTTHAHMHVTTVTPSVFSILVRT